MRRSSSVSVVFGIILVLLGVAFLLNNLGVTRINIREVIETYWPLVLVALGLSAVLRPRGDEPVRDDYQHRGATSDPDQKSDPTPESASGPHSHPYSDSESGDAPAGAGYPEEISPAREASGPNVGGWILIGLGVLILAANTRFWGFDLSRLWGTFWAAVVILIGWSVLRSSPPQGAVGSTHWVVMSGLDQRATDWPLRSGSYVVVMGGAELDLRVADIPEGDTYLDLTAIMGGIDVIVPSDLGVECDGTAVLGAVTVLGQSSGGVVATRTFAREGAAGCTKRLQVRCRAIMGAVELK